MSDSGGNRPNRPIRPRGGPVGGRRKRRVVIDSGGQRPRPGDRQARDRQEPRQKSAAPGPPPTGPVTVESGVTVQNLSQALGVSMPRIITFLMNELKEMRTATQSLSDEEVELIAADVGREVTIKHVGEEDVEPEVFEDTDEDLIVRPPVVTIMGHVDHGKTTLLDAIRESKVVETEAGGITQHIGAYQVQVEGADAEDDANGRRITFLDTPGHEAFTAMRARGAKVTDIAVLVVAADDGVMPQTRESISHARAAEVPIVVAVNKVDLPDANLDRVKNELAQEGLQPEEWGGQTQFAEVSAKTRQNLDELLEKILLVADLEVDPKANPKAEASGPIVESRLDVGRGPVATILVQRGTLHVGDAIWAGDAWGKVRALHDFRGERVREATPGDPVEILGFDRPPPAGEFGRVVENERQARHLANLRGERIRREQLAQRLKAGVSLEGLFTAMQAGEVQDLNIVLKGDVQGSRGGARRRARQDRAPRGARQRHPPGRGRDHRERHHARLRVERARRRLQRAPERRGAPARRPRGRRDPHLPRHLRADRRTSSRRSSACSPRSRPRRRSARPRCGRSSGSRASARSPAAWSRTASCGGTRACASSARAR